MDTSNLSKNIIKNLSTIPGILGFCNIDESHEELKESNEWLKSLSINVIDEVVNLNVSIIVSIDSTINNISQQIKQQFTFNFKKMSLKLGTLNIYIKGVK